MNKVIKKYKEIMKNPDNYNLFKNIFLSFVVKGFSLVVSLFSMSLYISYFNDDVILGLWFTLLSVLNWISTFDLGLGNGLRNKLVSFLIKNDKEKINQYISSSYIICGLFSFVVLLFGILILLFVDLNKVFNVSFNIVDKKFLLLSLLILFAGTMFSFVLKLINSIFYALQKSAINNIIALISSIIPLIFIACFKSNNNQINLFYLSIVYSISICLPLIIANIYAFKSKDMIGSFPKRKYFNKEIATTVLNLGGQFFIVQILFMLISATNEYFITYFFDPKYVVKYQIYSKLFMFLGSFVMLGLTPLWSAITKSYEQKNYKWIKKVNNILYIVAIFFLFIEFLIIPFLQFIFNIWLRENTIIVNYNYAIVFAIYGSIYILNIILTTISNGIGYLKTQLICYSIGIVFKVLFVYFGRLVWNDWIIVIISNIIVLSFFCIVQIIWQTKYLKKLTKRGEEYEIS